MLAGDARWSWRRLLSRARHEWDPLRDGEKMGSPGSWGEQPPSDCSRQKSFGRRSALGARRSYGGGLLRGPFVGTPSPASLSGRHVPRETTEEQWEDSLRQGLRRVEGMFHVKRVEFLTSDLNHARMGTVTWGLGEIA